MGLGFFRVFRFRSTCPWVTEAPLRRIAACHKPRSGGLGFGVWGFGFGVWGLGLGGGGGGWFEVCGAFGGL